MEKEMDRIGHKLANFNLRETQRNTFGWIEKWVRKRFKQ